MNKYKIMQETESGYVPIIFGKERLNEQITRLIESLGWANDGTAEANDLQKAFIIGYNSGLRDAYEALYLLQIDEEHPVVKNGK